MRKLTNKNLQHDRRANFVWPLLLIGMFFSGSVFSTSGSAKLIFDEPGQDWESQSLPIGNGKLGAALLGNTVTDRIQFNEKTLWTGGPGSKEDYNYGYLKDPSGYLSDVGNIQKELNRKGQLSPQYVADKLGRDQTGYGSYQSFGHLILHFPESHGRFVNYRRALDLDTAIASVEYLSNGVQYKREYFISYPDNSFVIRLTSNKPSSISFSANIKVPENRSFNHQKIQDDQFLVSGALHDNQLKYAAILSAEVDSGEVIQSKDQIKVSGANSVTLRLTAATDYALSYPDYRDGNAVKKAQQQFNSASQHNYEKLKSRHLQDYQALYSRVSLDLGQVDSSTAINKMLDGYQRQAKSLDRTLEHIYFQYGRYLLIASSRAGSLPANLQGIWNKDIYAPWSADYHLNINLQMNYWLADMTNLPETLPPLFDFLEALSIPGEYAAKSMFNSPGWVVFLNSNPWGSTGLIKWPTAFWQPEAAAWMSLHFFDHYRFSQDEEFLAVRAYPIMKSASEFWLHNLVIDPETQLLTVTPSYSPEHGNFTAGAAMSQQIVAELLTNTFEAAEIVGDKMMRDKLAASLEKMDFGLRIGSWGQLQEWRQDLDDKYSHHRHVSHLFALHPASQISPTSTPELAEAAKVSLNARGDGGTGWSKAWKINFWARLLDGNRAHKLLAEQLKHSTLANLWSNHPPFQIDGNFGATSGMTEMLLQSQHDVVHLLPALPEQWPSGSVNGLKARGDIGVDITWKKKQLVKALLVTSVDKTIVVKNKAFEKHFKLLRGDRPVNYQKISKDTIKFRSLAKRETVVLVGN